MPIEDQLLEFFRREIFFPIRDLLLESTNQAREILNSYREVLYDALRSGRIQYTDGVFSGNLSAAIGGSLRSIGATFDKRSKTYRIDQARVPNWVLSASEIANSRARALNDSLKRKLDDIQKNIDSRVELTKISTARTERSFDEGFKKSADILRVAPTLTDEAKAKLAEDYNQNMKLWIKKFSEEMIGDLRGVVQENAQQGFRFDSLVAGIHGKYGVTRNKAKFLARQETGLFMAKFRRERFKDAGVLKYEWSAAMDERTRDDHRKLDGHVFFYDEPPIVDSSTGRRANPGEDFNCRCVDIPIVERMSEAA